MFTLYHNYVVKSIQTIDPDYTPTKKEKFKAHAADVLVLVGAVSVAVGAYMLVNNSDDKEETN